MSLNTSKPGNADPKLDLSPGQPNRPVPLRVLLLGIAALLFTIFVGAQVFPVLFAILFPPAAPLIENANLVSHQNQDYGVDEWVYTSDKAACEVVHYYQEKGGDCIISQACNPPSRDQNQSLPRSSSDETSRCTGQMKFSLFALRWEAIITPVVSPDYKTEFHLSREIFWTGSVPPLSSN